MSNKMSKTFKFNVRCNPEEPIIREWQPEKLTIYDGLSRIDQKQTSIALHERVFVSLALKLYTAVDKLPRLPVV